MAKPNFIPAKFNSAAFNCPFCGVYAKQVWSDLTASYNVRYATTLDDWYTCKCDHCGNNAVWRNQQIVYPAGGNVPQAHRDLPVSLKVDYDEARSIVNVSPRGACALLRLLLQKLCKELGGEGKNINSDIKKFVEAGLPSRVQQALDSVRVIGNEAVHPGQLDMRDNIDVALKLFNSMNFIVEKMITEPKEIEELFGQLPEDKRNGIEERDKNK